MKRKNTNSATVPSIKGTKEKNSKTKKKSLSHHPIALGFSALAAMTVISSCSVKRAPHSDPFVAQALCKSDQALNTNAVNLSRQNLQNQGDYIVLTVVAKDDLTRIQNPANPEQLAYMPLSQKINKGMAMSLENVQRAEDANTIASLQSVDASINNQINVNSISCENKDNLTAVISSPVFAEGQEQVKVASGKNASDYDVRNFVSMDGQYKYKIKLASKLRYGAESEVKGVENQEEIQLRNDTFDDKQNTIVFKATEVATGNELIIISQLIKRDQLDVAYMNLSASQYNYAAAYAGKEGIGENQRGWLKVTDLFPNANVSDENLVEDSEESNEENEVPAQAETQEAPIVEQVEQEQAEQPVATSEESDSVEATPVANVPEAPYVGNLFPPSALPESIDQDQVVGADLDQADDTDSTLASEEQTQAEADRLAAEENARYEAAVAQMRQESQQQGPAPVTVIDTAPLSLVDPSTIEVELPTIELPAVEVEESTGVEASAEAAVAEDAEVSTETSDAVEDVRG